MATRTVTRYRTRVVRTRANGRAKRQIPIAVYAGFAPLVLQSWQQFQIGGADFLARTLVSNLTGYSLSDRKWYLNDLVRGWTPIVAGMVLHKLADRLGINRALSRSGLPLGI